MARSGPDKQERERIEALKRSLQSDPRSLVFVTLAEAHNALGEFSEAADVAQRGLLSHPDSVAGRLALAVSEAERDNVREALEQIKRALIIDQENPKALGLMGQILLKRGLAKRAVQFLSHAVKLAPEDREYAGLLDRARKMMRGEPEEAPPPVPVFDGVSVPPSSDNPWAEEDDELQVTSDGLVQSEHTVFDPDALKQLQGKAKLRKPDALQSQLDSLADEDPVHEEEEPTAFLDTAGRLEVLRRERPGEPPEEPTAFAAPNPLAQTERPEPPPAKLGGSAAKLSQVIKRTEAVRVREEAERRVRRVELEEAVEAERLLATPSEVASEERTQGANARIDEARADDAEARPERRRTSRPPRPPSAEEAPEPERVEQVTGSTPGSEEPPATPEVRAAAPAAGSAPEPVATSEPRPLEAPAPAVSAAPAEAKPEGAGGKAVGPVSTRMVDDALWSLYGASGPGEGPSDPPEDGVSANKDPKKASEQSPAGSPAKVVKPGKEKKAEQKGPMVVRTSARFGTWTRAAAVLTAAVAAFFLGHWAALVNAGPGPEIASEELKGIASDLERGGLASLLAAEDQIVTLGRGSPELTPLLDGALAEVYARRWWRFGGSPRLHQRAVASLAKLRTRAPTVEVLTARVILSTSTEDRAALRARLRASRVEYPESPKALLVEGWTYALDQEPERAIESFYAAHQLHPQHRGALLAIARWHAEQRAYGAAFGFFDQLQDKYPDDVEVAIERYVLGQLTGEDPRAADAVTVLAGLVREELPQVAKDEAGRAALAFALPLFAAGKLIEGVEELEKAESAFEQSPSFKRALAGAFLAVGEFERAELLYAAARKLGGDVRAARIGVARARLGRAGGLALDLVEEGAKIEKRTRDASRTRGVVELPFGTLRFVPGRFELLSFEPKEAIFPEAEYARLADELMGDQLQQALEAASYVQLGELESREGNCERAVTLFDKSNAITPSAAARFGLARCLLAKKKWARAQQALEAALPREPSFVPGWLMLARARRAQGDVIGVIEALERFEGTDQLVPDALYSLGLARLERGDWEGAARDLEVVVEHMPRSWRAQVALGEAQHKLGRPDVALQRHRVALEMSPWLGRKTKRVVNELTAVQLMYLGRALRKTKPRRAATLLKASVRSEDSPLEASFYLGEALVMARRTRREGRRSLERYIRVAPDGPLRSRAQRLLRRR